MCPHPLQRRFNELTVTLHSRIDAEYARNVKAKESLVERARGLLTSTDSGKAIEEVKGLQEKWKSVGVVPRDDDRRLWEEFRRQCDALPKSGARQLQDRFERAFERCERAVSRQHARDAEYTWMGLLDAASHVRAYRLALVRVLLNTRGNNNLATNELALRTLCIRAEILTDAQTPAEDHALRREYQLRRLLESMGQGGTAESEQLDTLAFEWLGVGSTGEATYVKLTERFKECRRRALLSSRRRN